MFWKFSLASIYTYGFLRPFFYNDKLYKDDKPLLLGYKFCNHMFSTFFAFPLAPVYLIDDLNAYDAYKKNIKYTERISPLLVKYIVDKKEE